MEPAKLNWYNSQRNKPKEILIIWFIISGWWWRSNQGNRMKKMNKEQLDKVFYVLFLGSSLYYRLANFMEMIINITVLFPQNVNDINSNLFNLFPQHFSLNTIVSEPFPGEKEWYKKIHILKITNFFQKRNSQTLVVFLVSHLLLFLAVPYTGSWLSYCS